MGVILYLLMNISLFRFFILGLLCLWEGVTLSYLSLKQNYGCKKRKKLRVFFRNSENL